MYCFKSVASGWDGVGNCQPVSSFPTISRSRMHSACKPQAQMWAAQLLAVAALASTASAYQLTVLGNDPCSAYGNGSCFNIRDILPFPVTFSGPGKRVGFGWGINGDSWG